MTKRTTCATLLQFEHTILACHATGTDHWDLPKGLAEEGEYGIEDHRHAAIRELREETGLILYPDWLTFVNEGHYDEHKDIVLYHHRMLRKVEDFYCTSHFVKDGIEYPEVDAYEWMSLAKFISLTSKVMRHYLERNLRVIEEHLIAVR